MSTTIYLVRHGEVDNPKHIEYMRLPGFGLSTYGAKQAEKVAKVLTAKGISAIYSSPLSRTKETAKIIAGKKLRVSYSTDLIEVDYKKWQGIERSERSKKDLDGYQKNPVLYSAILGESLPDVQKRVTKKLISIIERHKGEKIVVVTHAVPIITAKMFFENRSLMDFHKVIVNYASVTTITFDDELKCKSIRYNEYAEQRKGALDINE